MRLSVASLRRVVKSNLTIQFVPQALTSYGGLELLQRYLRQTDVVARPRTALRGLYSDYGSARLVLVILALFYVGARRLEHLRYLGSDPLVTRFCGLVRLPTPRTVANWLRQFTQETLTPLVALNRHLVTDALARLQLARLTIDVDGSVICTGSTVGWALAALWAFACGRGAQEKTFAELKGEFGLDVVPTKHHAANSAWQQFSILAHNLIRSFQPETLATPKARSRKRTYTHLFRSMRTLRFLLIARAGQLTRIGGRQVPRLTRNPATQRLYDAVAQRLAA